MSQQIFGTEPLRLLREKWPNPTMLAEELFAILRAAWPTTQQNPLTIQSGTAQPLLKLQQLVPPTNYQGGGTVYGQPTYAYPPGYNFPPRAPGTLPVFPRSDVNPDTGDPRPIASLQRGDLPPSTVALGPDGGWILGGDSLSYQYPGQTPVTVADKDGLKAPPNTNLNVTAAFAGQVLDGGPGVTYDVAVYLGGRGHPPTTKTVTQLVLADTATIPVGTWVTVYKDTDGYWMNVPTWTPDDGGPP